MQLLRLVAYLGNLLILAICSLDACIYKCLELSSTSKCLRSDNLVFFLPEIWKFRKTLTPTSYSSLREYLCIGTKSSKKQCKLTKFQLNKTINILEGGNSLLSTIADIDSPNIALPITYQTGFWHLNIIKHQIVQASTFAVHAPKKKIANSLGKKTSITPPDKTNPSPDCPELSIVFSEMNSKGYVNTKKDANIATMIAIAETPQDMGFRNVKNASLSMEGVDRIKKIHPIESVISSDSISPSIAYTEKKTDSAQTEAPEAYSSENLAPPILPHTAIPYETPYYCDTLCNDNPCSDCCPSPWYFQADLLFWRALDDGLQCGCGPSDISDASQENGNTVSNSFGRDVKPNFCWNPGFRIGGGYYIPCSHWALELLWTNFYSEARGHSKCQNKLNWKLNFNLVDFIAKYDCINLSCIEFIPFGGIRTMVTNQHQLKESLTTIKQINTDETIEIFLNINRNRGHQRFFGVGPIFGFDTNWDWKCGFGFYGNAAVSVLYGEFNTHTKCFSLYTVGESYTRNNRKSNACQAIADLGFGFQWQHVWCDRLKLQLKLGWEHHRLFDHCRISSNADLCLDGVIFSGALQY